MQNKQTNKHNVPKFVADRSLMKRRNYGELTYYKEMERIKLGHGEICKCDEKASKQQTESKISWFDPAHAFQESKLLTHCFGFYIELHLSYS